MYKIHRENPTARELEKNNSFVCECSKSLQYLQCSVATKFGFEGSLGMHGLPGIISAGLMGPLHPYLIIFLAMQPVQRYVHRH